jgi:hypothetical protein
MVYVRFEVFMMVKIQVKVFWAVTPCCVLLCFIVLWFNTAPQLRGARRERYMLFEIYSCHKEPRRG